jgi:hypothetical protein
MRKIVLGLVAATVALPTIASAQPGYDPYYGGGRYAHPADRNGDGVVTEREARRYERRAERQAERSYNNGYYGNSYSGYGNSGYGNSGYGNTRYGNSYDGYGTSGYGSNHGGAYSQYYDRNGYYSGPTWRGNDGSYYCRRSDGTTGTIVGGAAGALIGRSIAGNGDRTLGTIIGGAIGAVIGNSVERSNNRQRCN